MLLINCSGIEGSGKSTASQAIHKYLLENNIPSVSTREPGGTPVAEEIRNVLQHFDTQEAFDPMTELLLFYAARNQLFKNVIIPSLAEGKVVMADRSYFCSYAYQVCGRNVLSEEDFWTCHNLVMKNTPAYDLIVHLYTDTVEEGIARARGRGELDRIEKSDINFFKRAAKGYIKAFEGKSNVLSINTSENDEAAVQRLVIERLKVELEAKKAKS
jgi:dTMP kinase